MLRSVIRALALFILIILKMYNLIWLQEKCDQNQKWNEKHWVEFYNIVHRKVENCGRRLNVVISNIDLEMIASRKRISNDCCNKLKM